MNYALRMFGLAVFVWASLTQASETDALKATLEKSLPGIEIDSLEPVANTGLFEAVIKGQVVYFSKDGKYLIQGDVISLADRSNLTEQKQVSVRKTMLNKMDESKMIIFAPAKPKYTVTVFTDIDCGYCRKLHSEIAQYNELGIRVRYAAFPRAGIGSEAYDDAVSVWCAKDQQQAMTDAKAGKTIAKLTCDNPVKDDYELGQQLGVQGTPAIFLTSGQMLPGYVPPKQLRDILDKQADLAQP